ncbi:MAG: hypothetical protein FWC97_12750 [Treponema sp.]|nr:hypothetical protein [Treponema sp.]
MNTKLAIDDVKFLTPLFKKPWVYIIICIVIVIYFYLFHILVPRETYGILEWDRSSKVLLLCFSSILIFFMFFLGPSPFAQKIETRLMRSGIVLGLIALTMICVTAIGGKFYRFDHEKLETYRRFFPFRNAPYVRIGNTLYYENIADVRFRGGEGAFSIEFIFEEGRNRSIGISSASFRMRSNFLLTLYRECDWLRESIVREFGSNDRRKTYIERELGRRTLWYFDALHFAIWGVSIWAFLIIVIGLVLYVLKIDKRYKDKTRVFDIGTVTIMDVPS